MDEIELSRSRCGEARLPKAGNGRCATPTASSDRVPETVKSFPPEGRGHTVRKTIDCVIGTFCIREQYSLIHRDKDYAPFEKFLELAVIHP